MSDLRLAIIAATGTAQKRLIPAVRERCLCNIVAIHGRDQCKLATLAADNSIPQYFLDAEKMLDETKPDFVFIASPPALHQEHIAMCVEKSIPILCEKPLCLSTSEAAAIHSLLAGKIHFRLAHHLRHQPGVAALRNIVCGNAFGKLLRVAMQWGFWLDQSSRNASWKLDPATGGPNSFYDAGVHAIDLMLHLLPRPTAVTAVAHRSRFRATDDNVSALLLCENVIVEINASQSTKCPSNALALDFEEATISIPHAFSEKSFEKMEIICPSAITTREFEPVNLYGNEVVDFIALLRGEGSYGTTVEEACQSVQILHAITESYTTLRTISLD